MDTPVEKKPALKGKLNLEHCLQLSQVVNDIKIWQTVAEKIDAGTMPPRGLRNQEPINRWSPTAFSVVRSPTLTESFLSNSLS
jgi:hypothetical protein